MAQFKGDLNNDGRITMIDIPLCLRAAGGMIIDESILERGDVDGDGSTTLDDLKLILDHINGVNLIDGVIRFGITSRIYLKAMETK